MSAMVHDINLPPLGAQELRAYLTRVGFSGVADATHETLFALHRAHLLAIPYENLDIHLGRPLGLDPEGIFAKLVTARRGGWCYEMNGLFARVLRTIGFDVDLVAGAVGRDERGEAADGTHLVLIVRLDRPYIVDVGFGDGFLEPLPLAEGRYAQGLFKFAVSQDRGRWVVHNHEHGGAASFDFTLTARRMADFTTTCRELQTSPESSFVQKTICQRFVPQGIVVLRGAVFRTINAAGVTDRVVESAEDYESVLQDTFSLRLAEARMLFPIVWQRHQEWLRAPPDRGQWS